MGNGRRWFGRAQPPLYATSRARDFLRSHGTYRLSRHGHDRGCFARQGHKFDLVTGASRMDHHNPVNVPPVIPVPAASARRPHRAFPAKARTHCVPRMALNLEVKVLFGPQGAEPIAKGNCVAALRGGKEAGGKSGSRRTDIGYKASAVGQPGDGRGRPILLPSRARVDPAVAPRKCSVLPWETSSALRANRSRVSVTAPDGRGGGSRGHSSAHPWGRREGLNL